MQYLNKNIFTFIKKLQKFDYKIESIDHVWNVIFHDKKKKWHHLSVTKYQDTYYISSTDKDLNTLEVCLDKNVKIAESFGMLPFSRSRSQNSDVVWNDLMAAAHAWLKLVEKNWIAANKKVYVHYPANRRYGIVPSSVVRELVPDLFKIDKILGKVKTNKFIRLVESGYFLKEKNLTRMSMTAEDFFNYCKIAYIAGQEKGDNIDKNLSGKKMYERYADGRDDGLLAIDTQSPREFADWVDGTHLKKSIGGHPWEIKRGGNTTHIDLFVSRPSFSKKEGFVVCLKGNAITRLKETICMFLGLYDAGLPITIDNPEGIRSRLLGQDNIGIVPSYDFLHRANQFFSEDKNVFDVLHFNDLGKYKSQIKHFITWEPLPILKPEYDKIRRGKSNA